MHTLHSRRSPERTAGVAGALLLNALLVLGVVFGRKTAEGQGDFSLVLLVVFALTAGAALSGGGVAKMAACLWGAVLAVSLLLIFRNAVAPDHDSPALANLVRMAFTIALPQTVAVWLAGR